MKNYKDSEGYKAIKWIEMHFGEAIKKDIWTLENCFENKLPIGTSFNDIERLGLYDARYISMEDSIVIHHRKELDEIRILYAPKFKIQADYLSQSLTQKFMLDKEKVKVVKCMRIKEFVKTKLRN
ncbi:MAG: hypothetical protein ACKVOU_13910 [Cytophagales bacterium]